MNRVRPHSIGYAFALFLGVVHAAWAVLIFAGWAQPLLNWVFQLHMITPPYQITAFSFATAVELVVFTTVFGFVMGWFAGMVWNLFTEPTVAKVELRYMEKRAS